MNLFNEPVSPAALAHTTTNLLLLAAAGHSSLLLESRISLARHHDCSRYAGEDLLERFSRPTRGLLMFSLFLIICCKLNGFWYDERMFWWGFFHVEAGALNCCSRLCVIALAELIILLTWYAFFSSGWCGIWVIFFFAILLGVLLEQASCNFGENSANQLAVSGCVKLFIYRQ